MIAKDDIVIRKAILHILDTNRGQCILSNTLLNPGPDYTTSFEIISTKLFLVMILKTVSLILNIPQFILFWKLGMNQMKLPLSKLVRLLLTNCMLLWVKD